ncbi:hypothetical protein FB446DRAFT_775199 [Lentinula raphanica]|nr:hypothetical protein FB446DRAFT_775199 [Lentinula raphanica]
MTASYTPLYDHTTTGSNTKFVVANILYRLLLKIPIHASGAQCCSVYSGLHLKPSGYREPSVNDPDFPFCNEPGTTTNEVLTVTQTRTATITLSKTIEPSVTPTSKTTTINTTKSSVLLPTTTSSSSTSTLITSSGTTSTAAQSSNTNGTQASHTSSSKSSRPGVIVGGVLGAVFGLMVVVLCIFYIRRRTQRPRPVRHDSTVESQTMSQPLSLPLSLPPPVPPKGIPVNITPDPFMLKYSEAHQDPREPLRSDISSSTEQPRGSSSQPNAHDNTSISELMGRLRTLEAQFAVDKLYRMRNPTPSPPNYMEEARHKAADEFQSARAVLQHQHH